VHVTRMGEVRNEYSILVGRYEGWRDHVGNLGLRGKTLLK
jgi:hypothetical protein